LNITFPEHNFLDELLNVNNFRLPGLIKAAENYNLPSTINSLGAFLALHNEFTGTHSLLKKITAFSENHICPSAEEFSKIDEFTKLNV
jgi:hypothetical protein